jgi:hypothetical protein
VSAPPDPSLAGLAAVLVAGEPGCLALAARLFPGVAPSVLAAADFAPPAPFEGPLFALLESVSREAGGRPAGGGLTDERPVLGLVVPVGWYGAEPAPDAVLVADHVNMAGRGPLTGRWPAGRTRTFPSVTGLYQPSLLAGLLAAATPRGASVAPDEGGQAPGHGQHQPPGGRPDAGGPIYSALAVAGVADADRLTPFESRQMRRCGLVAAAGLLVAPAVIAAYHGLAVAAAGVPRAPKGSEGTQWPPPITTSKT